MRHLLTVFCTLPMLAQSVDHAHLLGQRMAAEIRRQTQPVADPTLTEYATNLLRRLQSSAPVELILSDASHPLALPGGPVAVGPLRSSRIRTPARQL
jgi:predicted Zn-dependent protease